jgi:hypothetical protein
MDNDLTIRCYPYFDKGARKAIPMIFTLSVGFIGIGFASLLLGSLLDRLWNVLMPEFFWWSFGMVIQ